MMIREILEAIPHRFPFLLVDRVVELVPGDRIVAYKNVTINEEFFVGHFPTRPIMPGVLVLEALAQTAALLAFKTVNPPPGSESSDIFFVSIDDAKFRRPIVPGDRLTLEVKLTRHKMGMWKFHAEAFVDGERAAQADLMAKWELGGKALVPPTPAPTPAEGGAP